MLSCDAQGGEGGSSHQQNTSAYTNLADASNGDWVLEEDEEDDVDFNPFLKDNPSPEASSGLSSDNEGIGAREMDNIGASLAVEENNSLPSYGGLDCSSEDSHNELEDDVANNQVSHGGPLNKEPEDVAVQRPRKRKLAPASEVQTGSIQQEYCNTSKEAVSSNDNASTGGAEVVEDVCKGNLPDNRNPSKPVSEWDNEDAICRRTRARYSLASFTLDELENFLQESDDDDLQNVDDEEEYRKFLAAVLRGGDGESNSIQENENMYDEDEENDADFELEIEEALESDIDEKTQDKDGGEEHGVSGRRPETRQNRRQKASLLNKKFLGQADRPLRPLLPFVSNAQMTTFPGFVSQNLMPGLSLHCPPFSAQVGSLNGFTPHQIGQLYCLIHEHVQLLVQVFSLCVLDPSHQHVVGEVKSMISEIIRKRDEALAWRKVPYPNSCFQPPYIYSSVSDGYVSCAKKGSLEMDGMIPISSSASPSERNSDDVDILQNKECSLWMPLINDPTLSVLDVAPAALLGSYLHDVSKAIREHNQRHAESLSYGHSDKEPLFPLPAFPAVADFSSGIAGESNSQGAITDNWSLPGHGKPRKTLAATLVESTKRRSVALVSKEIVKLTRRFYPLFNSSFFPHKPPPASTVNRVLFTDVEDELLALGMMEYNTDWKAIQQRFLPCKSKHQIFVRQKNRCSSKASENPIKAVRRMKTSPLTAEEKARIHEGLKLLKLDWVTVWRCIVPYRDPSLLPRQWRIALGTQKSYKLDAEKKEKRRLYASMKRKRAASGSANGESVSDKEGYVVDNVGEGEGDKFLGEDEACVHEAFLADWGSFNSKTSSELPLLDLSGRDMGPKVAIPAKGSFVFETPASKDHVELQPENSYKNRFLSASNHSQDGLNVSQLTYPTYGPSNSVTGPEWQYKPPGGQVRLRPYRVHRKNTAQFVKLAPDLPPVNLPPSVRVLSQSVFGNSHPGSSSPTKILGSSIPENLVPRFSSLAQLGTANLVNSGRNRTISLSHGSSKSCLGGVPTNQSLSEEKGTESDLHMHPLLFQAHEDAGFPYLQTGASRNFNFLPGSQLQVNFNHMYKLHDAAYMVHNFDKMLGSRRSSAFEFHPLLQRVDHENNNAVASVHMSADSELFPGSSSPLTACAMSDPQINSDVLQGPTELANSCETASDVDLEIHLCSRSKKEEALRNIETVKPFKKFKSPSHKGKENCHDSVVVTDTNQGHCQNDDALDLSGNTTGGYMIDAMNDHSLPEILMEQEELSDSEEECGDHVEFECEEMADSEGEEFNGEQLLTLRNKETLSATVEEVTTSGNPRGHQRKSRTQSGLKNDVQRINETTGCPQNTGLVRKGKDKSNQKMLLSQDSSGVDCFHPESKVSKTANMDSRAGNNLSRRPSRSCKKVMPNPKSTRTPVCTLELLPWSQPDTVDDASIGTRKIQKRLKKNIAVDSNACNSGSFSNNNSVKSHPGKVCLAMDDVSNKAVDSGCLNPSPSVQESSVNDGRVEDVQLHAPEEPKSLL
ncbi:hypothetical protein Sjap_015654 [Stephania japonica]|uniref:Uncharacterized protein n=1 Tax=Stephania japonica TaxID=461633 RepID=A0AAP0NR24_9MAGN